MIGKVFCLELAEERQPQCSVSVLRTRGKKRTAIGPYLVHILGKE